MQDAYAITARVTMGAVGVGSAIVTVLENGVMLRG